MERILEVVDIKVGNMVFTIKDEDKGFVDSSSFPVAISVGNKKDYSQTCRWIVLSRQRIR